MELTDLEICQKIAAITKPANLEYDKQGYPVIKVQSIAEWIDFNPIINAEQLKSLVKAYFVSSEFKGAGVASRAHTHVNELLVYGGRVFNSSYEKSVLLSIINLFNKPELENFMK